MLISLEAQSTPFPAHYFTKIGRSVYPVTWWLGAKRSGVSAEMVAIAKTLLSSACSSASIERVFSNFGAIHSKLRNRLGNEKAAKIVFCYRMLQGPTEIDY